MMKPADRYIEEVMRHVFAAQEDRERLEADLRAHYGEAEAEGKSHREIVAGLGTPEEVAAAFNAERELRYAGFWRRLVAFIGDVGVLTLISLPILALGLLTGVIGEEPGVQPIGWFAAIISMGLALAGIYIFYFPLLESHFGKTLGKHLMRIRVVRENGAAIGLGQAFVRRLSLYFDILWLDALFVPFTDKRQRAFDVVARTVVAKEPGEDTPWWGYAACLVLLGASLCCLLTLVLVCTPG